MKKAMIAVLFIVSLGFCAFTDLGGGWVGGANIAQVRVLLNPSRIYFEVWPDAAHTPYTPGAVGAGFTYSGVSDVDRNQVLSILLTAASTGQTINFYRVNTSGTTAEHVTLEVP